MATATTSDPADLSLDELEDELATLASHVAAGMCRWLELVGELDRRGSWGWGCGSCAEWLAWRCALLPRTAREHVRVARRLPDFPLVHAAFARGELSFAKVRALTRLEQVDCEEELLGLARVLTASQLERALRAYRRVSSEEARNVQEREQLEAFWDEDGSLVVRGRLAPEVGALFLRALEAARDAVWQRDEEAKRGSAEPRDEPRRPTNAEALSALADLALAQPGGSRCGGERYQVVIHVEEGALEHDGATGCELEEGPRSPRRRRGDSPATPRSSELPRDAASRSASAGRRERSRLRYGGR